jgi:hypothetical protein
MRSRLRATLCRARLSCRSPERLSRWRTVWPLLAGMGAAPSEAKAACERILPAWDQEIRNCAAVTPRAVALYAVFAVAISST